MSSANTQDKASDTQSAVELMKGKIETALLSEASGARDMPGSPVRIEVTVPDQSPVDWLMRSSSKVRLYWRDRDGRFEMAGTGVADWYDARTGNLSETLESLRNVLEAGGDDIRYYGGCRFDIDRTIGDEWQPFGKYLFVLPRFELTRTPSGTRLACNLFPHRDSEAADDIVTELNLLLEVSDVTSSGLPAAVQREDEPDRTEWSKAIGSALNSIREGRLEKIVLARRTSLAFDEAVPPLSLMREISQSISSSYCFYFQPAPQVAFMGVTPERLYSRKGTKLICEAIAGTRPRGETPGQDEKLAEELLSSDKDIREHRFVVNSIVDSLSTLSGTQAAVDGAAMSLLKLERVQHLMTPLKFKLNSGVTDVDLLNALHPTAAVGGYPREDALEEIRKLENFDRGWYAGPVGWLGKDESELAVAIRSALIKDNSVSLFGGAGIVEGSDPDNEWEEINAKIAGYIKVLMP
jgi:menaquinone-specific isochorismate synthase